MSIKKYKICKRLGPIFEKCQTQKFAMRQERARGGKRQKRSRPLSDFGVQQNEKQKVKLTYGLRERQFAKYVNEAVATKGANSAETLFHRLESRLDNIVFRAGLALSRMQARQFVNHGHISVNGKRVSIPSYRARQGDTVGLTSRSQNKGLFINTLEREFIPAEPPVWLKFTIEKKEAQLNSVPHYDPAIMPFDLGKVVEFYRR
jgi:small subunit ribosomal protein S4